MTKLMIFLFFWFAITFAMNLGQLWTILFLMPTFLWLFSLAETLEEEAIFKE